RWARQYDRAIEHLKKLEEMDSNYERTPFYLAKAYEDAGRFEEATAEYVKGLTKAGIPKQELEDDRKKLLEAAKKSGPMGYWKKLSELNGGATGQNISKAMLAGFYARTGQRDEAIKMLEKIYE